jgi:hypothetical protein
MGANSLIESLLLGVTAEEVRLRDVLVLTKANDPIPLPFDPRLFWRVLRRKSDCVPPLFPVCPLVVVRPRADRLSSGGRVWSICPRALKYRLRRKLLGPAYPKMT